MASSIIHLDFWARSSCGNPISLYKKNTTAQNQPWLFVGGVHGDEPEGVRLAEDLLKWLRENEPDPDIHPWMLIPCLNVDGHLAKQRTNGNGVDLNRNFPSLDWSKSVEKNRYYSGPNPLSEPESLALVELVRETKPRAVIHFHSWIPGLIYTGEASKEIARVLQEGNPYPIRDDIGYPTPGSLGSWCWGVEKTPVVCVEEQEKIDLNLVWPHFSKGLIKLLTQDRKEAILNEKY